jgi:hypothetical protein
VASAGNQLHDFSPVKLALDSSTFEGEGRIIELSREAVAIRQGYFGTVSPDFYEYTGSGLGDSVRIFPLDGAIPINAKLILPEFSKQALAALGAKVGANLGKRVQFHVIKGINWLDSCYDQTRWNTGDLGDNIEGIAVLPSC